MKVLVIGLGSIARKHIAALRSIDESVEVFALRSKKSSERTEKITNCYSIDEVPFGLSFIIISNPTSLHLSTIKSVVHLGVPLFIEKPPVASFDQLRELKGLINKINVPTYVAFNLRFHPIIQWLKNNIGAHRVIEVNAYCGSYLPDWRSEIDYRHTYSAIETLGGGVHLDLSHEIDYLIWIFGRPHQVHSQKRQVSDLEIDSIDIAKYWFEYSTFGVSLTMNYYRKDTKRMVEVVTSNGIFHCDLLTGKVEELIENTLVFESNSLSIADTYLDQMSYFIKNVCDGKQPMNSLNESLETMEICLK